MFFVQLQVLPWRNKNQQYNLCKLTMAERRGVKRNDPVNRFVAESPLQKPSSVARLGFVTTDIYKCFGVLYQYNLRKLTVAERDNVGYADILLADPNASHFGTRLRTILLQNRPPDCFA